MIQYKSTREAIIDAAYPTKTAIVYCTLTNFILDLVSKEIIINGFYSHKVKSETNGESETEVFVDIILRNIGIPFTETEIESLYTYLGLENNATNTFINRIESCLKSGLEFYITNINPIFGLTEETDWEKII